MRSTNPIESTFATVRESHDPIERLPLQQDDACEVSKLIEAAQKSWRCLDGHNQLPKLITGAKVADGIEVFARTAAPQAKTA